MSDTPDNAAESPTSRRFLRGWTIFEAVAVLASPAIAFFVLRLRAMAPTVLPDPSLHTSYIVDPRDVVFRYARAYAGTERLRELARVGFLVPARLDYLAFGAVPGFFVTRYLFALIAVVPTYMLLRRVYSRAAGWIGIVVIVSCPVVITAWGTDYPDSATVSYLIGALACIAMPAGERGRRIWLSVGSALLTMAIWSHSAAVPLVIVIAVVYVLMRATRDRPHLVFDMGLMVGVALVVTGALSVASGFELGQFNFISPTWRAFQYLNTPAQKANWHTNGVRWVPYLPYLLVPPAVVGVWYSVFARRLRSMPTATLLIGIICFVQVLVYALLQFFGSVQTLEQHYFSSALWASVCLTLAVTLAEIAKPFFERGGVWLWLPGALVLAVPLVYEAAPREPSYTWWSTGVLLAAALVAGGLLARFAGRVANRLVAMFSTALGLVLVAACALFLTAVPVLADPNLDQLKDPAPAYSSALGGSAAEFIDIYRVSTELPAFVGRATYRYEELFMWWPATEVSVLVSVIGMYHSGFNSLPSVPPVLTSEDVSMLDDRRPAEMLILDTSDVGPQASLDALARFQPVLMRSTVLRSGAVSVYAWLINLKAFGPAR